MKNPPEEICCLNCGAPIADRYCPQCGQDSREKDRHLTRLIYSFTGAYFSYDGQAWQTVKALFARPGEIPKKYLEGKRASLVPPVALYVLPVFWPC